MRGSEREGGREGGGGQKGIVRERDVLRTDLLIY